jgi:hypothetical protein
VPIGINDITRKIKMTRFKDFGKGIIEDAEPLSFKLYDEDFICVKQVQGKILMELVSTATGPNSGTNSLEIIEKFFQTVLLDESYERFEKLLVDKERIVTVETLGEITGWLIEEYTSRPEQQPEDSSTGQ